MNKKGIQLVNLEAFNEGGPVLLDLLNNTEPVVTSVVIS
jgi:hypothetical protein